MAILNDEEFMTRLHEQVGTDTSEASLSFLEDITDTFLDLKQKAQSDVDWEKKYQELDNSWREKYRHRFFSAGADMNPNPRSSSTTHDDTEDEYDPEDVSITDLFDNKS